LFATVACGYGLSKPGRADSASANLTPASGRQDHTTSPYATTSLVRVLLIAHRPKPALRSHRAQNAAASTASRPAFRDDHDTPLFRGGMGKVLDLIWGEWEQEYFCKQGWTPESTNCLTGKSPSRRFNRSRRLTHQSRSFETRRCRMHARTSRGDALCFRASTTRISISLQVRIHDT
jgi:hypothetical protein